MMMMMVEKVDDNEKRDSDRSLNAFNDLVLHNR